MRKIFFLLIFLTFGCKSKKVITDQTIENLPTKVEKSIVLVKLSEVEELKLNRAESLGIRLLEACNTSKFKTFSSSEATDKVIQNATPSKISSTCQKINFRNGKFLGLKLLDITHNQFTNEFIFRYAIDYEKKMFKRELFVTINEDNKVSAISTKEVKAKPF